MTKVQKAKAFATKMHKGQIRKVSGLPYITHPAAVVDALKQLGMKDQDLLAAAWLHDVVEDCEVSIDELKFRFGDKVAELVGMVTNPAKPEDGNRSDRFRINCAHLKHASPEAMSIKLADIMHNCSTLDLTDVKFADLYFSEKSIVVGFMTDCSNPTLHRMAEACIQYYFKRRGMN